MQSSDIREPRREAKSLLSLALKKDQTFLLAHDDYELTGTEKVRFLDFIERRSKHEPFQHIAQKQEFWRLDFVVTPDVMIPRHETELIVEAGIKILRKIDDPTFCELGVGSGCISISILYEVESAKAFGVDVSEKALKITAKNASNNGVLERLDLKTSDIFEAFDDARKFDLIVSNPPYIPGEDVPTLQAEVRDFDPHIALTDGKDGLSIIEKIINGSPACLSKNGFLLIEIGFDQSKKVRKMFDRQMSQRVEFFNDLQGFPRMVKAQLN